jgi:hypothetical protein
MTELNLRDTITPKSDQLNADDLIGISRTITVTAVRRAAAEQPVAINFEGDNGKPYLPCKSMRRVLIQAWGDNGAAWVGRSMTLYRDDDVKFGGVRVGGIRISHLSHIERDMNLSLSVAKAKRAPYAVAVLRAPTVPTYPADLFAEKLPAMRAAIASGKSTVEKVIAFAEKTGKLTDAQKAAITAPQPAHVEEEEQY